MRVVGRRNRSGRVWVVVLGDFGRSPRMQYHTLSLSKQAGLSVDVLAEGGSRPMEEIADSPRITIHTIPDLPQILASVPGVLGLVLKTIFQAVVLLVYMLFLLPAPDAIFLQVPPAIPTLPVCWLAAQWHRARFIIDWHNFAYTLMALKLSWRHPVVKFAQSIERSWGKRADYNFCVTKAMKVVLERSWGITATVFYDRPPAHFKRATLAQTHELLTRKRPVIEQRVHPHDCCANDAAERAPAVLPEVLPEGDGAAASFAVPPAEGEAGVGPAAGFALLPAESEAGIGGAASFAVPPAESEAGVGGAAGFAVLPAESEAGVGGAASFAVPPAESEAGVGGEASFAVLPAESEAGVGGAASFAVPPAESEAGVGGAAISAVPPADGGAGVGRSVAGDLPSTSGRGDEAVETTIATRRAPGGDIELREDRPALIVSSTSWTPDENFGLLLEAARLYDAAVQGREDEFPRLLIFVTGRGPQKAAYEEQMRALDLRRVAFRTTWLEAKDYPVLLGSCDLGVCLHTSSSGLDLPMKVVDMFGCGLPVCAVKYDCITELVAPDRAGLLFTTPAELAEHLQGIFRGFPHSVGRLAEMRRAVEASVAVGWDDSWVSRVQPVFTQRPRWGRAGPPAGAVGDAGERAGGGKSLSRQTRKGNPGGARNRSAVHVSALM